MTPPATNNSISPETFNVLVAAAAAMTNEPSEEILTVIAAAATNFLKDQPTTLHYKPKNYLWSLSGRLDLLSSHRIR